MQNSTNVHKQLLNMLYSHFYFRDEKVILLDRNRLRALVVFVLARDTQIQVAHTLCKQGCRLISYRAYG